METNLARELSKKSSIPLTTNLGRYLGVNLVHGRVTKDLYSHVLDWMSTRLEGWKTRFLRFARRQILIKSVLNTIPLYTMQTNLVPKGVCEKVEHLGPFSSRNFLTLSKIQNMKFFNVF